MWARHVDQLPEPPTTVQLLGAADGLVSRDDSLDIEQLSARVPTYLEEDP